jgi:hypothetical protein
MPIGEDIPLLIPISIVLVVFIVFLVSLFINFTNQNELVLMSQNSITTGNYFVSYLGDGKGNLDFQVLKEYSKSSKGGCDDQCLNGKCCDLEGLNYRSNFKTKINFTNLESGECWCWSNNNEFPERMIVNSYPVLISDGANTTLGKVTVSVGR